ncbi:FUN14 domain-containing protein 1 [Phytophthora citrophthora]|uniref:FUN14 domain-containing protein 1 n=1 Tax=Phytophthora citrophthora TaxID=4793 RepID=A0AAD9LCS0_9STRA|nr:FUN14 domain-containing protein 1 [Phytophthora citrophthora]
MYPSIKLGARAMSSAKKLQNRSQALALRLPARTVPRTPHIVVAGAVLSASVSLLLKESAFCQDAMLLAASEGPSGSGDPKKNDPVEHLIDAVLGNCGELTLAGGLGFCSGYALKTVGKVAAVAVGLVFIMAQAAAYNGYIDIKWGKVQKDMIAKVDPNGDGKIDSEDVKLWYRKLLKVMKTNLPSSAGFSSGFALGIYYL